MRRAYLGESVEQLAGLGDLYDSRTGSFIGTSLFSKSIPESSLSSVDCHHTNSKLIQSDKLSDRLTNFDIPVELQVSWLAGLVSFGVSGEYFQEQKSGSRNVSMSMLTQVTSKEDKLRIYNAELLDCFRLEALKNDHATHVVVGITWGAKLVVSAESEVEKNEDPRKISAELSAVIAKWILKINGKNPVGYSKDEEQLIKNLRVQVYGDFLPAGRSVNTVEEAIDLASKVPSLIEASNGGRGKPLFYTLLPLETLRAYWDIPIEVNNLIISVGHETLKKVVGMFEDLTLAERLIVKYINEVAEYGHCLQQEDVDKFKTMKQELSIYQSEIRSTLAQNLPEIRSGACSVEGLETIIRGHEKSRFSLTSVQKTINSWGKLIWKMNLMKLLKNRGAYYLGRNDPFPVYNSLQNMSHYCFYMKSAEIKDYHNWTFQVFLDLCDGKVHQCIVKDCDINPQWWPGELRIDLIGQGQLIEKDIAERRRNHAKLSVVRNSLAHKYVEQWPNKRANLYVACPGKHCGTVKYQWHCEKCQHVIEYGFDDNCSCYCQCGMVSALKYEFRCTNLNHGAGFVKPDLPMLNGQLKFLEPIPQLNILIIGETGVGKSTWINAFYNYIQFKTLDEAMDHGCLSLVPSTFYSYDSDYNKTLVSTGTSLNECQEAGQSATIEPKVYSFPFHDKKVRLIDTPGIGDVRGIEQDKENFEKVLQTLSNYDEIHGICILLKANSSRLNVMFQFCILELLHYLHRDACNNIAFCFTNSRGTNYSPGDTLPPLQKLLEKHSIDIALAKPTIYCFDSEIYRFLAAVQNGAMDPSKNLPDARRSWEVSWLETSRLMEHIQHLKPHKLKETISLNNARRTVQQLAAPLAELHEELIGTMLSIEREKKDIEENTTCMKDLESKMVVKREKAEREILKFPQTACAHGDCVKIIDGRVEYPQICHGKCYRLWLPANTIGHPSLMRCNAFRKKFLTYGDPCNSCGHECKDHLHRYYLLKIVETDVVDDAVVEALNSTKDLQRAKELAVRKKEGILRQLKYEQNRVQDVSVKFAWFLKRSAIVPYNNELMDYVDYLIKQKRQTKKEADQFTIEQLENFRDKCQKEIDHLEKEMENAENAADKIMTPEEVENEAKSLCNLPRIGKEIKKIREALNGNTWAFSEEHVNLDVGLPTVSKGLRKLLDFTGRVGKMTNIS